jgi:predicted TIM-barrel fold metal-dependent hydrolase
MTIDINTHLGKNRMHIYEMTQDAIAEQTDMLISQMDNYGIDKAVLCPQEPWINTELYIDAAAIYPERLIAACSTPPRPLEKAREKLKDYADRELKALVIDDKMYHPNDPASIAIVQMAIDADLAIYFQNHEMSTETVTFIERISTIYPEGRFVVLHMGGLFGFPRLVPLMGRDNIWLEISITLTRLVESPLRVYLDALVQDLGVRRLVFGSEHHTEYENLLAALNMIDLNIETSEIVRVSNAHEILKL